MGWVAAEPNPVNPHLGSRRGRQALDATRCMHILRVGSGFELLTIDTVLPSRGSSGSPAPSHVQCARGGSGRTLRRIREFNS